MGRNGRRHPLSPHQTLPPSERSGARGLWRVVCFNPPCRRLKDAAMPLTLSLNTNPLVNRFADPDDLIDSVAGDLKIRDLQLPHEFVSPGWPAPVVRRVTRQMAGALARTGVLVPSGRTGSYGRLNHF